MFWRLLSSILIALFVTAETGFFHSREKSGGELALIQQKQILEWNLIRNQAVLGSRGNDRILGKIEQLKKQNYRLFLEESVVNPRKEIKLRLSQENLHDRTKHL